MISAWARDRPRLAWRSRPAQMAATASRAIRWVNGTRSSSPPVAEIQAVRRPSSRILTGYFDLRAVKWAIEKANSLDGNKLAAALSATSSMPTNIAGLNLNWTVTPSVHNGFPSASLKECTLKQGPYDILDVAS